MVDSQQHEGHAPQSTMFGQLRRRAYGLVAACLLVLALFSGGLWWVSQGLEERLLRAIQPHLATDVQVGSMDVSLLSAWPNVEVRFEDVRIEDALRPGVDFLSLEEIGVSLAWLPLIENRLEVRALTLRQGQIGVEQRENGRGNWTFWKADAGSDGESPLAQWKIDELLLEQVKLVGRVASGKEDVVWTGQVQKAQCRLSGQKSQWAFGGDVVVKNLTLEAAGERWLDGVQIETDVHGRFLDNDVTVALDGARVGKLDEKTALDAELRMTGGQFGLFLQATRADAVVMRSWWPEWLDRTLGSWVDPLTGVVDVDVAVGDRTLSSGGAQFWPGPEASLWSGEWAVRLKPRALNCVSEGQQMSVQEGAVWFASADRGWFAEAKGLRSAVAGGEALVDASASGSGDVWALDVTGEAVMRPKELWHWAGGLADGFDNVAPSQGGVLSVSGGLSLSQRKGVPMEWAVQPNSRIDLEDAGLLWNGSDVRMGKGQFDWDGQQWSAVIQEVHAPGLQMNVQGKLRFSDAGPIGEANADVSVFAVDELVSWTDGLSRASGKLESGHEGWAMEDLGQWRCSVQGSRLTAGALVANDWQGQFETKGAELILTDGSAATMGGEVFITGMANSNGLDLQGRMANVDVQQLLDVTQGLGQSTLLPEHVRGRGWAQGGLTRHFNRSHGVPWDAELEVRVEKGELVDFALLQEIPATLAAERKYRWIADAKDLGERLKHVRFEPVSASVRLENNVLSLSPTEVRTDAMDVGVEGTHVLGGTMDYTLDFALRDLKSNQAELGTLEEDGLGHRFFLAVKGTLEDPKFGYDREAHQQHRKGERRLALDQLRGALGLGEQPQTDEQENLNEGEMESKNATMQQESAGSVAPSPNMGKALEDDEDDF